MEVLGIAALIAPGPIFVWGLIVAGVGGVLRLLVDDLGTERVTVEPPERLTWEAQTSLALLLSVVLVLGIRSLAFGVKVVSDGPIYHLYFAARWWKAGRLFLVPVPFGESAAPYFPANGDLWFTWLLTIWDGETLAKVGQAPFFVIAGLAACGCARQLGASRSAAIVATCWFAAITPYIIFSFEANVDSIFVAAYLTAAYFFLRAAEGSGATPAYALGALAAGGALGTKSVGVVFVPPLLALAVAAMIFQHVRLQTKMLRAALLIVLPVVSGGFWYFRNAILTGNPLYPLSMKILGRSVFVGWYDRQAMASSPYYIPISDWRALGDILLAVLDPRMAPLWAVAVLAGWLLMKPNAGRSPRLVLIFSLMTVLNVALYWVLIPYRTQQRFMLHAWGLAVVPLAITLDRSRWIRGAAVVLLALHLCSPEGWPFIQRDGSLLWDLTPSIPNAVADPMSMSSRIAKAASRDSSTRAITPLVFLCAIIASAHVVVGTLSRLGHSGSRSTKTSQIAVALVASGVFLVLGAVDAGVIGVDRRLSFYPPYPDFLRGWLAVESRSGSAGVRIAYAGTNIPYYLFGLDLRNQVSYVNINRHREWLLHDYHTQAIADGRGLWPNSRPGWDREDPDYAAWLENIDAARIQLLVVTRVNLGEGAHNAADPDNFPIERGWADTHPERFEPIYGAREGDPWFRLYRVRR
jgi:hypothetical protein